MSNNQNWNKMGEDIKDALSEALRSGDFTNLNDLVSQSVSDAINEVRKHIPFVENGGQPNSQTNRQDSRQTDEQANDQADRQDNIWQKAKEREAREREKQQQNWQKHLERRQAQLRQKERQIRRQEAQIKQQELARSKALPAFPASEFKKVGSVSSILYQVFGGIGLGVTLLIAFILLIVWAAGITVSGGGWLVNFIFQLCFLYMIRLGIIQRRRLGRAERYLRLCGNNKFATIENLAKGTGKKARNVIKDIQKMLSLGMFPEGHLDEQKTCLMLNDEVYRQYQQAENGRRLREAERQKAVETSPQAWRLVENLYAKDENTSGSQKPSPEISGEQESELNTMVAEGMECIRKLRYLNDQIPGEVISAKLSRLENLLKDIFDSVREHPEQMHRMHKMMDYYLPTTLKLVEAYEEFDRVKAPGTDIAMAKAEIENTLDTINQAFTELLNNLFQDAVLDATTDAQVLKTMLAREGLMREMDFQPADNKDMK